MESVLVSLTCDYRVEAHGLVFIAPTVITSIHQTLLSKDRRAVPTE